MNATRLVVFFVGVVLVIVAAWMLFVQTGLSRWIPMGIAAAALLFFIGVVIMGASEKIPSEHKSSRTTVEEHHGEHP